MTSMKNRWSRANDNFRKQIRRLQAETEMSIEQIAEKCCISRGCMYNYLKDCSHMEKVTERYLTILFETNGMRYDPALGEGAQA
jgi:predicted DNA-binding protein YlxM (UPF0122 family)